MKYSICHPDNDGVFVSCFDEIFASIQAAEFLLAEFLLRDTVGYVRGDFKILGA
jgi:hypothetical protein